jgi:metallo-beta-lactamase class B
MKTLFLIVLAGLIPNHGYSRIDAKRIRVSDDIELIQVTENIFMHVTYTKMQDSKVASNGMIFINNGEAFLFDTPMTDALTKDLIGWLTDSMKLKIAGFIPNHWHIDCMGGLSSIHNLGIKSYTNRLTIEIAKSQNLPVPQNSFRDSLCLKLGDKRICCYFPGAAHSMDNIAVWIPSEKVLFPGCMVKSLGAVNLGNTTDGDLNAYPGTITKLIQKFPDVRFVIPGHGEFGDAALLKHTLELAQ